MNETTQIATIATMRKGQTPMLITGDTDRNKFQVMPGGGYVSIQIQLPDNWDELVAPLGYAPLSSYYIENSGTSEGNEPQQIPSEPVSGGIAVPEVLTDGTYRIVPSEKQMTEAGRIYCADSEITYWAANASKAATIPYPQAEFGVLLDSLGYNCSFTVKNGAVTAITMRLSTVEKRPATNAAALDAEMLGGIALSFSITTKQSKEAADTIVIMYQG